MFSNRTNWIFLVLFLVLLIFGTVWFLFEKKYPAAFGGTSEFGILHDHFESSRSYSPAIGYSLPPLRLQGTSGITLDTEKQLANGKPTIIVFEATWCSYCKQELSELNKIAQEGKVNYLSIDIHEPRQMVDDFVKVNGINHPWYYDEDGSVSTWFLLAGTPTHLIVGRDGKIVARLTGYQTDAQLESAVTDALK